MKIAIIGCGSIGKRHAKNIISNNLADEVFLCDTDLDKLQSVEIDGKKFSSTADLLKYRPDAAFVCLPTHLHVPIGIELVKHGISVFIEKPLSNSVNDVSELIDVANKMEAKVMVGMSYRFHPIIKKIKSLIQDKTLGKIYSVNYTLGQNLLTWPSGNDYKKSYISQEALGGGLVLTTVSHMLDTVNYLFGSIEDIKFFVSKLSNFDINVDDTFASVIKTDANIVISIQADMMRVPKKNEIYVVGEHGSFCGDFYSANYTVFMNDGTVYHNSECFDFNSVYIDEVRYFVDCVNNNKIPCPGIADCLDTLNILCKIVEEFRRNKCQ